MMRVPKLMRRSLTATVVCGPLLALASGASAQALLGPDGESQGSQMPPSESGANVTGQDSRPQGHAQPMPGQSLSRAQEVVPRRLIEQSRQIRPMFYDGLHLPSPYPWMRHGRN